ncbi:MAG: formate dehydrogenase accessory protein FdhE [Desulfobacterales bacterium]|nr:formate dehydrogenase accessory protein FdhE [Desulfobacterales bacterium]
MPTASYAADTEGQVARAVSSILEKRPQLESLLRPFGAFFIEKTRLAGALRAVLDPPPPDCDLGQGAEGLPVLYAIPFAFLKPALERASSALVPVLKTVFPAAARGLEEMGTSPCRASLQIERWAEEHLTSLRESRPQPEPAGDRGSLAFFGSQVLSAVLQALAPLLAERTAAIQWDRGSCPICGALPSISFLSQAQPSSSEFLVGGGGQRWLHCALCGHDWRVRRHLCAACGNDDSGRHIYFQVPEHVGERVDVCLCCHHYLPCIDQRETGTLPHLDTLAVGVAHLDILAQEKGFHPTVRTPWNTFE